MLETPDTTRKRIKEAIEIINKFLANPDKHPQFDTERLMSLKSKYLDFLDLVNFHADVKRYADATQTEILALRKKVLESD